MRSVDEQRGREDKREASKSAKSARIFAGSPAHHETMKPRPHGTWGRGVRLGRGRGVDGAQGLSAVVTRGPLLRALGTAPLEREARKVHHGQTNRPRALRFLHHGFDLRHRRAARLIRQHVLAGAKGGEGVLRVQVPGTKSKSGAAHTRKPQKRGVQSGAFPFGGPPVGAKRRRKVQRYHHDVTRCKESAKKAQGRSDHHGDALC